MTSQPSGQKVFIFAPREEPPELIRKLENVGCDVFIGDPAWQLPGGSHEDELVTHAREAVALAGTSIRNTPISRRIMERNGITANDLSLFVSHQANRRIIKAASEKLGVDPAKVVINIERFGNTTAATIPLALNDCLDDGRLKPCSLVVLTSVGAGFTVGSVLLRWG